MSQQPATRMELLRVKQQKKLAQKGHKLLKQKRDALIKQFFALIGQYKAMKKETIEELKSAYEVLHVAQGVSGVNRVKSFAQASNPSFTLSFSTKNLMGVKVPQVSVEELKVEQNASMVNMSSYVKKTQEKFLEVVPRLVKLAEIEQVIFTVAEEIVKTKRRVNSLEYIKIPEIEGTEKQIAAQLAEMERESFGRLKNVKKKLESQGMD